MNKQFIINLCSLFLLCYPTVSHAQDPNLMDGLPKDLNSQTLILLKHESIEVGAEEVEEKTLEYIIHRQENHNRILNEFNAELSQSAEEFYPFDYILAYPSELDSLLNDGKKYVLYSNVYSYEYLKSHPAEGELIVFSYYVKDQTKNEAYVIFDLDEMKVYDAKMILKKLKKKVKEQFPEAY